MLIQALSRKHFIFAYNLATYQLSTKKVTKKNEEPTFSIIEALKKLREGRKTKFDETIDFQLKLNIDPKHGDQMVRGHCIMPGGLGKKIIIAVLTAQGQMELALKSGADFVGEQQILAMIKDGNYKFDKLLATTEMMSVLKPFARTLGPKGLMPNPKAGTIIKPEELEASIKSAKAGSIEFRTDMGRNLFAPVGKISFPDDKIFQNIKALSIAVNEKKPPTIKGIQSERLYFQGQLIKEANIKSTMGPRIRVDVFSFDQKNKTNLLLEY